MSLVWVPWLLIVQSSKDPTTDISCKLSGRWYYLFPCCITWTWHSTKDYAKYSRTISPINISTVSLYPSLCFHMEDFTCSGAKGTKIVLSVHGAIVVWMIIHRDTWMYKYILCRKHSLLALKLQQWYLEEYPNTSANQDAIKQHATIISP